LRLEICNLNFHYKNSQPLFQNLNIHIPPCERLIITGISGSGKTTLLKLISGLLVPDSGGINFEIDEKDSRAIHFAYLFQNPDNQFVHFNLERELAFNLENRSVSSSEMHSRVAESLCEYNLETRRSDSPNSLSGGEKQRLALAGMMISNPEVLLLDEPCSFLDIYAQLQLYGKIDRLIASGVSVIWISQEPSEIEMADYIIELESGRLVFGGNRSEYFKHKRPINAT